MKLHEFTESLKKIPNPVILLEGKRDLPETDRPILVKLAEKRASILPASVFRSGNTPGSDAAFSQGVQRISASRLECVLPYAGHRKTQRIPSAKTVAPEEVPEIEKQGLLEKTVQASPNCRSHANLYRKRRTRSRYTAKLLYLLRIPEAFAGRLRDLYMDESNPLSGGTGHNIRVCEQNWLPVLNQAVWGKGFINNFLGN